MSRRRLFVLLGLAVLGAVLVACSSDDSDSGDSGDSGGDATEVAVTVTSEGCPSDLQVAAGRTKFVITNDGANAIDEFEILEGDHILGEAEHLAPGLTGSFTLDLEPGEYVTYCPGGTERERSTLVVAAP
ncbi:MAG: cupredoxin domain-containing protein [Dehalococcoidia bacterium]|nr:cupredoxin domain-containing protein [Dehalococcoidia bacterium]